MILEPLLLQDDIESFLTVARVDMIILSDFRVSDFEGILLLLLFKNFPHGVLES